MKRRELGIDNFVNRGRGDVWTPNINRLLGKVPDEVIAKKIGKTSEYVSAHRQRHSICQHGSKRSQNIEWDAEKLALLGTKSDSEIACKLGVTRAAVLYRRKRLRIPPYSFRVKRK